MTQDRTRVEPVGTPLLALGAILAGGASRRFGAPKALASVAGTTLVERARAAVAAAGLRPVLIANDATLAPPGLPCRPDLHPGMGPLAGVERALLWARELGLPGALCVACDLPLLPAPLLRTLAERGVRTGAVALAPESRARQGVEPLCAWYAVAALPEVEARLARNERPMHALLDALGAARMPLAEVSRFGDPEHLFLNVNTVAERERAERLASAVEHPDAES